VPSREGETVTPTRVFIVSGNSTGDGNLKRLLSAEIELEIVGEEKDISQASEQIQILRPDIIIYDDESFANGSSGKAIQLLRVRPGLKIIGLSLSTHEVMIYQSAQKIARDTQDLVAAIKDNSFRYEYPDR
jgi:DNA-binding NarL/FixJ family response regulator